MLVCINYIWWAVKAVYVEIENIIHSNDCLCQWITLSCLVGRAAAKTVEESAIIY